MMQSLIAQASTVSCGFHIENSLLETYQEYLKEITQNYVGYPFNSTYDYSQFFPFLNFSINNVGDPFVESNYKVNSHLFEKGVLAFFAELYQAKDWWGYVTASGTEGNLYGLLLGRETYPDGILYASADLALLYT